MGDMVAQVNKKHRCYVSGPISGYDLGKRRKAFKEAQVMLEAAGYEVVNPMENGLPSDATTAQHMKRDIQLLTECDAIFMMDKWSHSQGCNTEFMVATAIGCEVIFETTTSEIVLNGTKRFKMIFK